MPTCPRCKNDNPDRFRKHGKYITSSGIFQKVQCLDCARMIIGDKIGELKKPVRVIGA